MAVNGNGHRPRRPAGPVLIGFADALAGPEAALSLLGAGLRVAAFTRSGSHPALRRHPQVAVHGIAAPEEDAAVAVGELCALAARIGAVAVMPLDDGAVWLCARAAGQLGVPVIGPTGEQAELALDKRRQLELARAAGFAVPETRECAGRDDLLGVDRFPVIVKPALALAEEHGRLVRGAASVCADRSELEAAAERWTDAGPRLVQPLIHGTGEGLFGLTADGTARHWSAHRRLRMVNPQGSGSSACVSMGPDPELADRGARMMRAAGWHGLFMLELLRDRDGVAWFMELNGRTWGSLALARRLGLEYPAWHAMGALGLADPPHDGALARPEGPVVCRHLGREIVHVLSVMRGPRSAALEEWPSRSRTLRDVVAIRRGERWYNWSARHPGVFLEDTLQTVRGAVARGVRA
jgi:predicted ATP-grasp superfamily ATP-dependent carboligase